MQFSHYFTREFTHVCVWGYVLSNKVADYISSYILDRMIEQDAHVKYAVEVMIKDNTVVLGDKISGNVETVNLESYVKQALAEIGYDEKYSRTWTKDATKADLTLNMYARKLACENLADNDECFVYLSSCIAPWGWTNRFIQNSVAREFAELHNKNTAHLGGIVLTFVRCVYTTFNQCCT